MAESKVRNLSLKYVFQVKSQNLGRNPSKWRFLAKNQVSGRTCVVQPVPSTYLEVGARLQRASLSLLAFSGLFCDQLTLLQGLVTSCACRNFFLARTKFSSTRDSHRVHEKNRPMRSETLRRQHPRSTVFSTIISKTLLLLKSLFGFDFYLYNSVLTKKTKTESVFS